MNGRPPPWRREEVLGLLVILVVSLLLRLRHLDTLLPWFLYVDEVRTTEVALHLLRQRTLDPSFTYYPAVGLYINALAYLLWAAAGQVGNVIHNGPHVLFDFFYAIEAVDPVLIVISRWVSLAFGLGSLVFMHLLARVHLEWRWALLCTLLFALNSMNVVMSGLAKIDTINLFWIMGSFWTAIRYLQKPRAGWLAANAVLAGLALVTKNNYQPVVGCFFICLFWTMAEKTSFTEIVTDQIKFLGRLIKAPRERGALRRVLQLREAQMWALLAIVFLAAVITSPYSFLNLRETLKNATFLYHQAATISTYHTDPHVWWLDRYQYFISVIYPFEFGPAVFLITIAGFAHLLLVKSPGYFNVIRLPGHVVANRDEAFYYIFIMSNLLYFTYVFASQAGDQRGAAYPYYLFLHVIPAGLLIALDLVQDLSRSPRLKARAMAAAIAALMIVSTVHRIDSFGETFFHPYDRLGPWLHEQHRPGQKVLMVSVYKPSAALGPDFSSIWPQDFTSELIDAEKPDLIVIDTWLIAGFRKVYRDLWVAPLVDSLLSGDNGYRVIKNFPADYAGKCYFAAIDPEHDVELIVLQRVKTSEAPP